MDLITKLTGHTMEAVESQETVATQMKRLSDAGLQSVVSIVKDLPDADSPVAPPSTPIDSKVPHGGGDLEADGEAKDTPATFNAFPRFRVTWDVRAPAKTGHGSTKSHEMTPEATLIEFITTSASFFDVKRQNMKKLEFEILKVFHNNIMPANAAAWYMAKRRFYLDKPWLLQLLPYLLAHNPKKFLVHPESNTVDFLEIYSKDVAKRKMQFLVHQGLFGYFSHKVDEYGVYFFDPLYYESTEPFHANLRLVTNSYGTHRSKLIYSYFKIYKNQFTFKRHSNCLVSISKTDTEVVTNTFGVVSSMIDNSYGIVQFKHGHQTEKAIFCSSTLYNDGFVYDKDPTKLSSIQFDGYKIPGDPKSEGKDYTWYAVLVWVGRKPSPKFNATKDKLSSAQYFQNQPVTYDQLADLVASPDSFRPSVAAPPTYREEQPLDDCMRVGEVITIQKNGAVVVMHKNSGEKAFIPGWIFKIKNQRETFLTTTQAVTLAMGDIIAFYIDPKQKAEPYYGVGCNVMVLKHSKSGSQAVKVEESAVAEPKKRNKTRKSKKEDGGPKDDAAIGAAATAAKSAGRRRKSTRVSSVASDSSTGTGRRRKSRTISQSEKLRLKAFLLEEEVVPFESYNSDEDPPYIPPPIFDPDLDYDEYSDGEIQEDEVKELMEDVKVAPIVSAEASSDENKAEGSDAEATSKVTKPRPYINYLLGELAVENDEEEAEDDDYNLPAGVAIHAAHLLPKTPDAEVKKSDQSEEEKEASDDDEISDGEVEELLKDAKPLLDAINGKAAPEPQLSAQPTSKAAKEEPSSPTKSSSEDEFVSGEES